ncbi:calcium-translocating P-type ATPase, SERCA-type, partial [Candidatus Woesearchaeota archaeon]|nr:calcium-translocating P-type ATPase, SERCA-type [Candidatus Woesearchaeota archaeon]
INAILGFVQEYRAEKSIEALKKLASLKAVVVREGVEHEINARELVPGDIIMIETGEKIPADCRLLDIVNLETQEAVLTGESLPVKKEIKVLRAAAGIGDRINMVFSGTIVTRGRGKAVVAETGMHTEIGKIAAMIQEEPDGPTHLQLKLKKLGEWLGIAAIVFCATVFGVGVLLGFGKLEMFMTTLALAVAAIPEGLPAVVTIGLALGVQRMVKRNALIRTLHSVETLGSTTVICSDKTGTLTHNEMTVRKIFANNKIFTVTGSGYSTIGNFYHKTEKIDSKELRLLLQIGALCNNAKLDEEKVIGDPTEGALIVSAAKAGLIRKELELKYPRIEEFEFTSERKRMSTFHNIEGKKMVYCKGAPDVIIELCDRIYINGRVRRLTRADKKLLLKVNEGMAKQALRVLGLAFKESDRLDEKNMIFIGMQGMIDPPRKEVKEAIKKCRTAGIRVVMITGDFKITAEAIGKELGLEGKSIDGKELDKIGHLEDHVDDIVIYARIDPKHKVKILEALKKKGNVVAMTGDGVNDAPALKKADIGIAMGITGTDVAKEASDMILTDDNFASIVSAVEEGRSIFNNIRKFVKYLLSSNLGELLTLFLAIILRFPLPLVAIQILWINLVTDGLPALALSVEPADLDVMKHPPRNPKEGIITKSRALWMIVTGIIMMTGTLAIFRAYNYEINLMYAQTMAFTTLVLFQMFNVLNCRSERSSVFRIMFTNRYMLGAIGASILLQILVVHTPLNTLFYTTPIKIVDWGYALLVSCSILIIGEVIKLFKR